MKLYIPKPGETVTMEFCPGRRLDFRVKSIHRDKGAFVIETADKVSLVIRRDPSTNDWTFGKDLVTVGPHVDTIAQFMTKERRKLLAVAGAARCCESLALHGQHAIECPRWEREPSLRWRP